MVIKYSILLILSIIIGSSVLAQPKGAKYVIADGDEYLKYGNYRMALPIYKEILKTSPDDKELQYKIALCYVNTNINRVEATKYLEFVTKDEKLFTEAWYYLGHVYHLANKLDEAIKAYEKFKQLEPKRAEMANHKIEMCKNAKQLITQPVNVTFTNLGKEINSEYSDYYPWINKEEDFLTFTSRRKGGVGAVLETDGYFPSDIYISQVVAGKWTKAKNAGPMINSALDEQVVGLKADASEMLIYFDHIDVVGDLYSSKKGKGVSFSRPEPLSPNVNAMMEYSGSISSEGDFLFFVRKEKEKENTDIYMSRKLPNGQWGLPIKLGKEVNTGYNEDFPYLAIDGKTLYFSSEGHNSMGGFDLFKSEWNQENNTWSPAENLGYPVNTTDDDRSISLSPDNRVGYVSAIRPGGQGDLDIYRIKFNDADQKLSMVRGKVTFSDSTSAAKDGLVASIVAVDKANGEEYTFSSRPQQGTFVMALPAGTYNIVVNADGYSEAKETIVISDLGTSLAESKKEFKLEKK